MSCHALLTQHAFHTPQGSADVAYWFGDANRQHIFSVSTHQLLVLLAFNTVLDTTKELNFNVSNVFKVDKVLGGFL